MVNKKRVGMMVAVTLLIGVLLFCSVFFLVRRANREITQRSFDELATATRQIAKDLADAANADQTILSAMAELIAQMEAGQMQNKNQERLVLELAERLHNTNGKKVYGYLPPATKALVDAIVDELAKDERVAAAYGLWNQMREEVCRTYSEQVPERLPLSKQKEFKAVRNMVVREVLQLGQGEHPTADEIVHMPTPPAQSGVPHEVYPPQQAAAHHQRTQTHRTVSHGAAISQLQAPRGYRPMCPPVVPQHGPHLPGAVRRRYHPGRPAHRQEAPPDAPGEAHGPGPQGG